MGIRPWLNKKCWYLLFALALVLSLPGWGLSQQGFSQNDLAGVWLVKFANGSTWKMTFDSQGGLTSWENPRTEMRNPHGQIEVEATGSIKGRLKGTYYSPKGQEDVIMHLDLSGRFLSQDQIKVQGEASRQKHEHFFSQGERFNCLWVRQ
jgi:hypothetical protein